MFNYNWLCQQIIDYDLLLRNLTIPTFLLVLFEKVLFETSKIFQTLNYNKLFLSPMLKHFIINTLY